MKQLFAFLLIVGLVVTYWKVVVCVLVVVLIIRAAPVVWREVQNVRATRAQRAAELGARADREHAQVMAGDEAGVYGMFPPAVVTMRNVIGEE